MANPDPTIIYVSSTNVESVSPGIVITGDVQGFDEVRSSIFFKGTVATLDTAYPIGDKGGKAGGANDSLTLHESMVCFGATVNEVLPGGFLLATVTWRGFMKTNSPNRKARWTYTRGIKETSYDALRGVPGAPNANTPVQAMLRDIVAGVSLREVETQEAMPAPPAINKANTTAPVSGVAAPAQIPVFNAASTVYNYPNGWICYSWQANQELQGIWFVSSEWQFVHDTTLG